MQDELAQEFNKTAVAAHAAFPRQLANLVVLLTPATPVPVFVSPGIAAQLSRSVQEVREAVSSAADVMRRRNWVAMAQNGRLMAGERVNLIALDGETHRGFFSERFTPPMRLLFNLDHEIAHHVLKKGFLTSGASPNHTECGPDGFAMLRHIQRFGAGTDDAGSYAAGRAFSIVIAGDSEHYTTDTVEAAIRLSQERDITKLSLQETAEEADRLADEHHLKDGTLAKILNAYRPAYFTYRRELGDNWEITRRFYSRDPQALTLFCRETLAVMDRHSRDVDVFKAGKRFLSYPPVREFMQEQAKTDNYWKEALGFAGLAAALPPAPRKQTGMKP